VEAFLFPGSDVKLSSRLSWRVGDSGTRECRGQSTALHQPQINSRATDAIGGALSKNATGCSAVTELSRRSADFGARRQLTGDDGGSSRYVNDR